MIYTQKLDKELRKYIFKYNYKLEIVEFNYYDIIFILNNKSNNHLKITLNNLPETKEKLIDSINKCIEDYYRWNK